MDTKKCDEMQYKFTGNVEKDSALLKQFLEQNKQKFTFPNLQQNGLRKQLWSELFKHLESSDSRSIHSLCLEVLRILSRDKTDLNETICERWLNKLLEISGLLPSQSTADVSVQLEALKCLCNLVFNSSVVQTMCARNNTVDGIFTRLRTYRDAEVPYEIKYFDMKLLFVITALSAEVRPRVRADCHGLLYLTETLDLILKETSQEHAQGVVLSDDQILLACEILKILFNLTVRSSSSVDGDDDEEESHFQRLVSVLHDLLLCKAAAGSTKVSELLNNIVNLLTSIPSSCYRELTTPMLEEAEDDSKEIEFEGRNMAAVSILLTFLKQRLDNDNNINSQHERLAPILAVLVKAVRGHRVLRKFLRSVILPPLTEVMSRPETGNSLRNQLCRLLTTPVTEVRDLTAELLFVLCKENVGRMIKYTGYGNAAGLFASRGLLGGQDDIDIPHYSSDSDSDTEEYLRVQHSINPVLGCYEPPRPDPKEGMSEEQKEYEAMQLVQLIDKLSTGGVIKPCRIGHDGRPEPIEQVLQLQDELPRQQSDFHRNK